MFLQESLILQWYKENIIRYYSIQATDYAVLRINLRNFRYINEICGAQAGDEAIIQYSRKLLKFTEDDECAGRMGGDNFVVYLHNENLKNFLKKIKYSHHIKA